VYSSRVDKIYVSVQNTHHEENDSHAPANYHRANAVM